MIVGSYRDGHPRIALNLPGAAGMMSVEFIVDTGFDGDLCVPETVARQLDAVSAGRANFLLADGSWTDCPRLELPLDWNEDQRIIEVLVLEGNPLFGTHLLEGNQFQAEATEGGEVLIEPL